MTKFATVMVMTSSGAVIAGPTAVYDAAVTGCAISAMFLLISFVRGPRRRGVSIVSY